MTRASLRTAVRSNLQDLGITYYSDDNINESLQDGYNEVSVKCRCITKSVVLPQQANNPYYDLMSLGVSDYLGTFAIFNQSTRYWLRDDITLRDFDRLRRDWEKWEGAPQFWASHSQRYIAVCPNLGGTNGELFTFWYWAAAPQFQSDLDVPLIAIDKQSILEHYATADKLEDAQEVMKAAEHWAKYEEEKREYTERCIKLAKADLLLRV